MHTVSELFIYPVKSTASIALKACDIGPQGFSSDRRWMLTGPDGRFITARQQPKMVLIQTSVTADTLEFQAPGMTPVSIPLRNDGALNPVTVWDDTVDAADCGNEIAAWLSDYLQQPCRLVHTQADFRRPVNAPGASPSDLVGFADSCPVLIVNQASLDDLNKRLAIPVLARHFRPNMVVSGNTPYEEDHWKVIRINGVEMTRAKLCSRCILTTVHPDTGRRSENREPFATLGDYRRMDGKINFGSLFIPTGSGRIACHDTLHVIESGE